MSPIPVVLYLRQADRTLVAIAPPGASMPSAMIANTIQMTVTQDAWQNIYQPAQQALAQGQDLVVNVDGSTGSVPHTASPAEQAYAILAAYLQNATPLPTDTVQALKTVIRVVRALV